MKLPSIYVDVFLGGDYTNLKFMTKIDITRMYIYIIIYIVIYYVNQVYQEYMLLLFNSMKPSAYTTNIFVSI